MPPHADVLQWEHLPFPKCRPPRQRRADVIDREDRRGLLTVREADLEFRRRMVESGGWFGDEPALVRRRRPELPTKAVARIENATPEPAPEPIVVSEPEPIEDDSEMVLEKIERAHRLRTVDIVRHVAKFYDIPIIDIMSRRRTARVVFSRQIAMYLTKRLTTASLPEIGRRIGSRDHTTVLHAVRKIEGLLGYDGRLQDELALITLRIRAG